MMRHCSWPLWLGKRSLLWFYSPTIQLGDFLLKTNVVFSSLFIPSAFFAPFCSYHVKNTLFQRRISGFESHIMKSIHSMAQILWVRWNFPFHLISRAAHPSVWRIVDKSSANNQRWNELEPKKMCQLLIDATYRNQSANGRSEIACVQAIGQMNHQQLMVHTLLISVRNHLECIGRST